MTFVLEYTIYNDNRVEVRQLTSPPKEQNNGNEKRNEAGQIQP